MTLAKKRSDTYLGELKARGVGAGSPATPPEAARLAAVFESDARDIADVLRAIWPRS